MRIAFRIWALALLYQTIILLLSFGIVDIAEVYVILLLIEFVGGIPGLFLFGAIMHHLHLSQISLRIKWSYAIAGAVIAAISTTLLTVFALGFPLKELLDSEISLLYPAPLSALLSLFTFYSSVNKYFNENTVKKIS